MRWLAIVLLALATVAILDVLDWHGWYTAVVIGLVVGVSGGLLLKRRDDRPI
jgi:hypothetical protein